MPPQAQDVLDFWFGPADAPGYGAPRAEWFRKDPRFDAAIRERFADLHAAAHAGALAGWDAAPESTVAAIIVWDQFSRNLHRGDARAFACDALALATARDMIARGWDAVVMPAMRLFVYLPFEHSEDPADQERAVALMRALAADARFADLPEWAVRHQVVIQRFGRFPHRNAALGRVSTPEEEAYLREPGSGF
ncbi:MAG: DUF924 domain-containing protein [Burkholderiales bacterium]|nr:DUF924 domain-containing protein [Burkholderiales bacterium]